MIRSAKLVASVSRKAGGLYESVRRLAQSLTETGMELKVIGLRDKFSGEDAKAWEPVSVSTFTPFWPQDFGYSPLMTRELDSFKPDIVHNHGLWLYPSIAAYRWFRRTRAPYLVSSHGMLDPWALANSHWKKVIAGALFENRHLRSARCLRALCASEARAMRQCGLTNPIAIIPNGIDLPSKSCAAAAPWELLLKKKRKVLLYLGRLHPKKGLQQLLRAWAEVGKTEAIAADWTLAVAGWDQLGHEEELKQLATALGLEWADIRSRSGNGVAPETVGRASVLFLGPQFKEAKAASYAHCDAFVLPSLSEGVPMVVLEAWTYSKPTVITPECNLPEAFPAGAAVRIEPNKNSVAEGLRQLFQMRDSEAAIMGKRGRELAVNRFAWPKIAAEMNALYRWMLGGGPAPRCLVDF